MPAPSISLGDVEITRVVEWSGPIRTARFIIPDSDEETWRRNQEWLAPDFWTPADDAYRCHIQTWVLRSEGRIILVDTGVGNDRERPQVPQFAGLRTDYLARLRAAGVEPEDVDVVVNTHIHYDHVGWNTELRDGEWVPTFPDATYLIPRADYLYFDPAGFAAAGRRVTSTSASAGRAAGSCSTTASPPSNTPGRWCCGREPTASTAICCWRPHRVTPRFVRPHSALGHRPRRLRRGHAAQPCASPRTRLEQLLL